VLCILQAFSVVDVELHVSASILLFNLYVQLIFSPFCILLVPFLVFIY